MSEKIWVRIFLVFIWKKLKMSKLGKNTLKVHSFPSGTIHNRQSSTTKLRAKSAAAWKIRKKKIQNPFQTFHTQPAAADSEHRNIILCIKNAHRNLNFNASEKKKKKASLFSDFPLRDQMSECIETFTIFLMQRDDSTAMMVADRE